MKSILFILLLSFMWTQTAHAGLFTWTDEDGVLHIVDDLHKVPQEFRKNINVKETGPSRISPESTYTPKQTLKKGKEQAPKPELFGDKSLEWWVSTFKIKREEISESKQGVRAKEEYIQVYESGRRFGRIYDKDEINRYENYKKELPDDISKLDELKDDLKQLLKSARHAGVPRKVRGD